MMNQLERLTRVEEQVNELRKDVDKLITKMDELIALKYKGAGAFWLFSSIIGTGVVGFIVQVAHWLGFK